MPFTNLHVEYNLRGRMTYPRLPKMHAQEISYSELYHGSSSYASPHKPRSGEEFIIWIACTSKTADRVQGHPVVAGQEGYDRSSLWVIRAKHDEDLLPGKFAAKHSTAYVPYCCKEYSVQNIEVLTLAPHHVQWVASSNGVIPCCAIPAGYTKYREPLYIGRVVHNGSYTPGKVHPSHKCCYISYGGKEVCYKNYEVLGLNDTVIIDK